MSGWDHATIRLVVRLDDPVVPAILDLYQTAFPPVEQMLASLFWKHLMRAQSGEETTMRLVALEGASGEPCGFALFELKPGASAYLCYLATRPDVRGQGLGERLYRYVCEAAFAQNAPAVVFEIEEIEEARIRSGDAAASIAERRLGWYRRLGARVLGGVHYLCGTDWHSSGEERYSPIPMTVLIHAREDISPERGFAIARAALGSESLIPVDTLTLT